MSYFADLCSAVVDAINAAETASAFLPFHVAARKDYALQADLEGIDGVLAAVLPGSFEGQPVDLQGAQEHRRTAVVVLAKQLATREAEEIEPLLALLETVWHEIASRVNEQSFELVAIAGEEPCDPELVRNESLFWSVSRLTFRSIQDE